MKWKVIKIVWGIYCVLALIVICVDFYDALKHPEFFPFGAEAVSFLWYYKTQGAYLWYSLIDFIWYTIGFLFCLLQHKFQKIKWGIIIHLFLTLLRRLLLFIYFSNYNI